MTERPAARSAAARSLAQVNQEPGRSTIFGVVTLLNAIVRPLTRRDWRAQDKIPQTGGVIFVVNHISNADPIALGQFLAFSGRWPRFLAKASLFSVPVLGRIIRACGQIPVQRQSARSADALVAAVEAVNQGRAVVIYPEGTITRDPDLWPMAGKTGAARVALRTGCPVIPIGQWGAQELMYGRQIHFPKLLPRKTFHMLVGDPVDLDDLRGQPVTAEALDAATERIMDAITALVAELRQQPPPAERFVPPPGPGRERAS
ncbi:MAG TPA: lysophospholipid acyltransferase family protein [Propionibacteriaceae bacterium]|jgi:1-acyl-sn-glycerol-3-phosphate acyltransferase|nr:lysophospholipid acyltransferase family protein [Propionibacteriaceae bacterium]